MGVAGVARHLAAVAATPDASKTAVPLPLIPAWLMCCYFVIVVLGGVVANVLLLVTILRWRCRCDQHLDSDADDADPGRDKGWWILVAQTAATDALTLCLVSGGELWSLRETGGPWRLPTALCAPFMGLEAMLGAAQTYLLAAVALHAWAAPADPVPSLWRQVTRSAVVPSALVWMLASSVAVPRTFLAVAVWPRPSLPLCTLLPTSPTTGALEGPLDVVVTASSPGPGPSGSWWPLGSAAVDAQGGGPLLSAVVLCVVPSLVLLASAAATAFAAVMTAVRARLRGGARGPASATASPQTPPCPPHKEARREWVRVSGWLSASWVLMSLPRLAGAAVHGFLHPDHGVEVEGLDMDIGPGAFRAPPLGSRGLGDAALLAAAMLHYALTAARPVIAVLVSPALRRALVALKDAPA
ncbi:uncharacterized protein LOC117642375, partial [Thrips palmi]|uniref:Uncharacterized protein LOC117642375 n=1 Tax=Thrips palmi TaxID=161013 RepID=A0A6P8YQJ1_THRPL